MSGTLVCFTVLADNFEQAQYKCESQVQDSIKDNFCVESILDLDTDNVKVVYKRYIPRFTSKEQLVNFVKERMRTPEGVMQDIRKELDNKSTYPPTMFYNIQQLCEIGCNNMSQKDIDNWDIGNGEFNPWCTSQFSVTNLTYTDGNKLYAVFVNVE